MGQRQSQASPRILDVDAPSSNNTPSDTQKGKTNFSNLLSFCLCSMRTKAKLARPTRNDMRRTRSQPTLPETDVPEVAGITETEPTVSLSDRDLGAFPPSDNLHRSLSVSTRKTSERTRRSARIPERPTKRRKLSPTNEVETQTKRYWLRSQKNISGSISAERLLDPGLPTSALSIDASHISPRRTLQVEREASLALAEPELGIDSPEPSEFEGSEADQEDDLESPAISSPLSIEDFNYLEGTFILESEEEESDESVTTSHAQASRDTFLSTLLAEAKSPSNILERILTAETSAKSLDGPRSSSQSSKISILISTGGKSISSDLDLINQITQPYASRASAHAVTGKAKRREVWTHVTRFFQQAETAESLYDARYVNVQDLVNIARDDNEASRFQILYYLRKLASQWDLGGLEGVYFKKKEITRAGFPRGPRIEISQESLKSGKYLVRTFFEAVHITLTRAMPENRPLKEYIAILVLFEHLITRLVANKSRDGKYPYGPSSSTISLLVSQLSTPGEIISRATIGFNVCGSKKERTKRIKMRIENLPLLSRIKAPKKSPGWVVGNCAEAETFAHIPAMQESILAEAGEANTSVGTPEIISMSLTLKLGEPKDGLNLQMQAKPFCMLCSIARDFVEREFSCKLLDLRPS